MLSASLPCRAHPKLWPLAHFSSGWIPQFFPEACAQSCPCCAQFEWFPGFLPHHHTSVSSLTLTTFLLIWATLRIWECHQPCPAAGKVPAALTLGSSEQLSSFLLFSLFLPPLRGRNIQKCQLPLHYKIGGTDRKRSRSQDIKIWGKLLNLVQNCSLHGFYCIKITIFNPSHLPHLPGGTLYILYPKDISYWFSQSYSCSNNSKNSTPCMLFVWVMCLSHRSAICTFSWIFMPSSQAANYLQILMNF